MQLDEAIAERVRRLPVEKQRRVLRFVEEISNQAVTGSGRRLLGAWTDLGVDLQLEELQAARREVWGRFPRDLG